MTDPSITPDLPKLHGWEHIQYPLISALATLMGALPRPMLVGLARFLGWSFWHFLPKRRNDAIDSIALHLNIAKDEARKIARQSFTENSLSFLEIFKVKSFNPKASITKIVTDENFKLLMEEEGPMVITIAHIGSWELMAALMDDYKKGRYKITVVRSQRNKAIDRFLKEARSSQGMTFVGHRDAASFVLEGFAKKNALVAFLVDHNASRGEARFFPFFEKMAAVNIGPALLALRGKATVFPLFLLRNPQGGHTLHVGNPLRTQELTGKISERVSFIAQYYTKACEDIIREHPEQWFWMHNRWRTQPK